MGSQVFFVNQVNLYEDELKSKPKVNLELDMYQIFLIKDSLVKYSKFLRHPLSMSVIINSVLHHFLTQVKDEKEFNKGVEGLLKNIWDTHERYEKILIDLYHSNITWDEHDTEWFERNIKYFEKTKLYWEQPHQCGLTKFEMKIKNCKETINYDERYNHRVKYFELENEKIPSLMSKIKTLF